MSDFYRINNDSFVNIETIAYTQFVAEAYDVDATLTLYFTGINQPLVLHGEEAKTIQYVLKCLANR